MLHLDLTRDNYDWHMSQIYKEDKEQLQKTRAELIEHEILNTKARLESSIATCDSIATTQDNEPKDRLEAEKLKSEISVNIIRLLVDGPQILGIEYSGGPEKTDVSDHQQVGVTTAMDKLFSPTTPTK